MCAIVCGFFLYWYHFCDAELKYSLPWYLNYQLYINLLVPVIINLRSSSIWVETLLSMVSLHIMLYLCNSYRSMHWTFFIYWHIEWTHSIEKENRTLSYLQSSKIYTTIYGHFFIQWFLFQLNIIIFHFSSWFSL